MTNERETYLPLVRGAIAEGWGLFRINDGSPGRKPADIAGTDPRGRAVLLEVKFLPGALADDLPLPWRLFEVQQLEWLDRYTNTPGALALVGCWEAKHSRFRLLHLNTPHARTTSVGEFPQTFLTLERGKTLRLRDWPNF